MFNRLLVLFLFFSFTSFAAPSDTTTLVPAAIYGKEAREAVNLLQRFHYRKTTFSDSLSSVFLNAYLESLDPGKSYFLESDIASFEPYRYRLDNLTMLENVEPAFKIFSVFRKRFLHQMDYVLNELVKTSFDYTADDYYDADRDKMPWPKTQAEVDGIWYNNIKSQALSLKLSGKKPDEIESTLRTRYERFKKSVIQYNAEDVFSAYMNALTESFDPHTNYLSPKASDLFKQSMSLSLEGIGARLQTENDYTKIYEVVPGGPADKDGRLKPNDLVIAVAQGDDGEMVDVIGWRVDDVVKLIKGPKGTIVRLQILPAATGVSGPSETIRLVRDKIKLEDQAAKKEVVHYRENGKDITLGIIKLPSFYMDFDAYHRGDPNYRSTTRDVRKLIEELRAQKVSAIAIDLRNNGGGSLTEAIDLTGLFINQGPVVQVKSSDNRIEYGVDEDPGVVWDGPLMVLTNRFSASASEIFAGAIQDYKRGVIFGESTFGKGTVQQIFDLKRVIRSGEPVGELKITYQKFYRVSGSSTQNKGVTPDVLLPGAYDAEKFGESASKSALPWDKINAASYVTAGKISDKAINQLNQTFRERSKNDASLKKYLEETNELRESINQTRVSLNEAKRKSEADEAEKKKSTSPTGANLKSGELPSDELSGLKDEFLREGLLLLTELVNRKIG